MQPNPATTDDPRSVLRHACAELEQRLRAGEDCHAEQFLDSHPSLASNPDCALELIQAEWLVRQGLGRAGTLDEWLARFPQWREPLRRWLDQGGASATTPDGPRTLRDREKAPPVAPVTGQVLDDHKLLGELGRGGMGVVYRAWDPTLKREVALKKIRSGVFADAEQVRRFYREAQAAAQLHHPHLVTIHGMGLHQGEHCFTMELALGGSLEDHKGDYQADPRAAVALVEKVARAVQAAHAKDIVHRDLKPANILLDGAGEPLVSDFGLARVSDPEPGGTLPGQVMGTPYYMAPEQASGRTWEVGKASDVWALGVILYELLTGRRPFVGETTKEAVARVLSEEPPRPRSVEPRLDPALEAVVLNCLRKEPARRYATAGELADDLGRWLRGEAPRARPAGRLGRVWGTSPRRLALGAAVALAATLALLAVLARGPAGREGNLAPAPAPGPIDLLGTDGFPFGGRFSAGEGAVARPEEGVVRLETKTFAMLELHRAPPWRRFRLQVDVQDLGGEPAREFGVYFAHQERKGDGGQEHWFCDFTFAEENRQRQGAAWLLIRRLCLPTAARLSREHNAGGSARFFPASRPSWRRLVVEVTPDTMSCSWGGDAVPFVTLDRKQIQEDMNGAALGEPPARAPAYRADGGLGLVCRRGAVLFRRPTLEPLPGER